MFPNDWRNLLGHEDEHDPGTKSEDNIVNLEEGVEALRLLILECRISWRGTQ